MASKGGGSIPNEDEPGPCCVDLVLDAAQLRRLLFAKQSAIVTEPDQHHWSLLVDRAQRNLVAFEIKHHALAESLTGDVSHQGRRGACLADNQRRLVSCHAALFMSVSGLELNSRGFRTL
jgi:hypothetical protein